MKVAVSFARLELDPLGRRVGGRGGGDDVVTVAGTWVLVRPILLGVDGAVGSCLPAL